MKNIKILNQFFSLPQNEKIYLIAHDEFLSIVNSHRHYNTMCSYNAYGNSKTPVFDHKLEYKEQSLFDEIVSTKQCLKSIVMFVTEYWVHEKEPKLGEVPLPTLQMKVFTTLPLFFPLFVTTVLAWKMIDLQEDWGL